MTKPKIHTDLGGHIRALYDANGNIDHFIDGRGPVQDESRMSEPDEAEVVRLIEAGKHRK